MRHHRHHYCHLDALLLKVYEKYPTNESIDTMNKWIQESEYGYLEVRIG